MEDRFVGSILGLALADALGAGHEGGIAERILWKFIARRRLMWTDDTQMTLGTIESLTLLGTLDPDHLARTWAENMEPMRGYGPGARKLLSRIKAGEDWRSANRSVFPDGSFGNGAAMRAAPIGLFFHRQPDELRRAAELASSITHAHPLGIEGGLLIARATALALDGPLDLQALLEVCRLEEFRSRLKIAQEWLGRSPTKTQVKKQLGTSVRADESAVTAVHAFCRFPDDFTRMVEYIIELGGDTDTIGAMAGGIFGARNGVSALPKDALAELEARGEIERLARKLYERRP